nr:hypothetical protein [Paracoccus saliphilus]
MQQDHGISFAYVCIGDPDWLVRDPGQIDVLLTGGKVYVIHRGSGVDWTGY